MDGELPLATSVAWGALRLGGAAAARAYIYEASRHLLLELAPDRRGHLLPLVDHASRDRPLARVLSLDGDHLELLLVTAPWVEARYDWPPQGLATRDQ